jgi:hypothetical protein
VDRILFPAGAALGRAAIRALGASLRLVEVNREAVAPLWAAGVPVIYAVWHGRMLMLPFLYGRTHRVHVLASRSRDGELVSRFVRGFGFRVVRGSSSRGGATALRELARLIKEERADVAVVPDGPRGPRYVAHAGPVVLARLSGAPIVPVAFGAAPRRVLPSWDAFVIPYPFARAAVVFGEPMSVSADTDRRVMEQCRRELESSLRRLTAAADAQVGAGDVSAV